MRTKTKASAKAFAVTVRDAHGWPEASISDEDCCECEHSVWLTWDRAWTAAIAAHEAQRQAGQDPVARVLSWTNGSYSRNYKVEWLQDVPEGAELYAAPQPAPVQVAGDAGLPVVAWLTEADQGSTLWLSRIEASAYTDGDELIALVKLADAQAALAAKDVEIARLQSELARPESMAVGLMRAEIAALTAVRDALKQDAGQEAGPLAADLRSAARQVCTGQIDDWDDLADLLDEAAEKICAVDAAMTQEKP